MSLPQLDTIAPLADADDVAEFLGYSSVDDDIAARLDAAVAVVSAAMRGAMGQTITVVENDVAIVRGTDGRRLVLGERPVRAVAAILVGGAPVPENEYRWTRGGNLFRNGGWFGPETDLSVIYSHGYDPVPLDLIGVCVTASSRLATNPTAGGRVRVEEYETVNAYPTGFTLSEQAVLDRYRHRTWP